MSDQLLGLRVKHVHTKSLLHQGVVCEGDALFPHPAMATFVDELTHRLQVGVSGQIVQKCLNRPRTYKTLTYCYFNSC